MQEIVGGWGASGGLWSLGEGQEASGLGNLTHACMMYSSGETGFGQSRLWDCLGPVATPSPRGKPGSSQPAPWPCSLYGYLIWGHISKECQIWNGQERLEGDRVCVAVNLELIVCLLL